MLELAKSQLLLQHLPLFPHTLVSGIAAKYLVCTCGAPCGSWNGVDQPTLKNFYNLQSACSVHCVELGGLNDKQLLPCILSAWISGPCLIYADLEVAQHVGRLDQGQQHSNLRPAR